MSRLRADLSAGQVSGRYCEWWRAVVPPRPPQRGPDRLAPTGLVLDEVRALEVEVLGSEELRLDQLLICASTAVRHR